MQLKMALDTLHRKIEEWTEEALIEPEVPEPDAEGFREFGSELVGYLHDTAEKLELSLEEVVVPERGASGEELCEELTDIFLDEWAMTDFAERPVGVHLEGLQEVMDAVAEVLEASPEDSRLELEEATLQLDEFLAEVL